MRVRFHHLLALGLICAGCQQKPFGVTPTNDDRWHRKAAQNALTGSRPSIQTERALRLRDLDDDFTRRPIDAIRELQDELREEPSRDLAAAIAELAYLRAKREAGASDESARLYGTALLYAYAYVFDDELGPPAGIYDPRYRLACDLYNHALAKLILWSESKDVPWGSPFPIPTLAGEVIVDDGDRVLFWKPGSFHSFRTVYEFEVRGLRNRYHTHGLGVPVILLRKPPRAEDRLPIDRFLNHMGDQAFPATAVVRIRGSVLDDPPLYTDYSLYDPTRVSRIRIGDREVPLESDITTPLAYALEHAPPISGLTGFLDVDAWADMRGLYFTAPYDPDKMPVVFIHGLMSSPLTWLPAINDVWGDPRLQDHYQVWYFKYPTGNPIVYSASVLRESLQDARAIFDPEGDDPAFNHMVLVGHSMGGLLTRMMVSHSDGSLWDELVGVPIDDLNVDDDLKDLFREIFYFEPQPFIKRVVFVATPHRGSKLAAEWFSRMASSMVKLPERLNEVGGMVQREGRQRGKRKRRSRPVKTSIDDLSPDSPDIKFISSLSIAPEVRVHSIIADHKQADTPGGTDTVVTYESAHLDDVQSELIIKGTHRCTARPRAIREVRRILIEHAEAYRRAHPATASRRNP